jgi:hypothetical protein
MRVVGLPASAEPTTTATATIAIATTEATATAATITAAEPTTTANAGSLGTRFVHGQCTAIHVRTIRACNGRRCLSVGRHFHKAEAFATTGFAVHDHIRGHDFAKCGEHL